MSDCTVVNLVDQRRPSTCH